MQNGQWTILDQLNLPMWRVLASAAEEAADLGAHELETPHLLIALALTEQAALTGALRRGRVDVSDLRDSLRKLRDLRLSAPDGPLPLSRRSKLALELGLREAAARHAVAPQPDDLLVGILAQEHSTAVTVLEGLGVDARSVHNEVARGDRSRN